jgi:hypothetical protein
MDKRAIEKAAVSILMGSAKRNSVTQQLDAAWNTAVEDHTIESFLVKNDNLEEILHDTFWNEVNDNSIIDAVEDKYELSEEEAEAVVQICYDSFLNRKGL